MIDIFLSYATVDLERARKVAQALEARGWRVWWDRKGSLNNKCRFWGVEAPVRQGVQRGAYSLYATLCATQPDGMDRRSKMGGYC